MSGSIIAAALWAIAATGVAFLPMQRQYMPGLTLLALAPLILIGLGLQQGWLIAALALFGVLSMFRNPLRYYWAKWRGADV